MSTCGPDGGQESALYLEINVAMHVYACVLETTLGPLIKEKMSILIEAVRMLFLAGLFPIH